MNLSFITEDVAQKQQAGISSAPVGIFMGFLFGFIFAMLLRMVPLLFLHSLLRSSKAMSSENHTAAAPDMYPPQKNIAEKTPVSHGFSINKTVGSEGRLARERQRGGSKGLSPQPGHQEEPGHPGGVGPLFVCPGQEPLLLEITASPALILGSKWEQPCAQRSFLGYSD